MITYRRENSSHYNHFPISHTHCHSLILPAPPTEMLHFRCRHSRAIMISHRSQNLGLTLSMAPRFSNDAKKNLTPTLSKTTRHNMASKLSVQCEGSLENLDLLLCWSSELRTDWLNPLTAAGDEATPFHSRLYKPFRLELFSVTSQLLGGSNS